MPVSPLPIDEVLPTILKELSRSASVVLQAPPGAGKTTRVPSELLKRFHPSGKILVVEPRRVAARSAARRMAVENGSKPGEVFGWQVRFENQTTPNTKVICITPGILLRLLQEDLSLSSVSCVIFDEFHERGLETDVALGLCRLVQTTLRDDLKIVVMSATLETENLVHYLGGCPKVTSEGRLFPVEIRYHPVRSDDSTPQIVARTILNLLNEVPQGVMAFLPGVGEIRATEKWLQRSDLPSDVEIYPLYGELDAEAQDAAIQFQPHRKIVLATNVAETSVTVEGISAIVDSGLCRQLEFDATIGLNRLELAAISQASAEQRAGRAGRLGPGICVRLWGESAHRGRPAQTLPEIRRLDVCYTVLLLLNLNEQPETFLWLDSPPALAIKQAKNLLTQLDALAGQSLTPLGQMMAEFPIHPRLARMLIEGYRLGQEMAVSLCVAILAERDPLAQQLPEHATDSDVWERVHWLAQQPQNGPARWLWQAATQFQQSLQAPTLRKKLAQLGALPKVSQEEAVMRSLLVGFPDRLAKRRQVGSARFLMRGGRGARLHPKSGVHDARLLLGIDVEGGDSEAVIRMASAVQEQWLSPERFRIAEEIEWDEEQQKVVAYRRRYYEDLLIEEKAIPVPEGNTRHEVFLQGVMKHWEQVLPDEKSAAGALLNRIRWLADIAPDLGLPVIDRNQIQEWLTWLVPNCQTLREIQQADWYPIIRNQLTNQQWQILEHEAPSSIVLPSGRTHPIRYQVGQTPTLAVRIQELFGLAETPKLARGKIRLLLHLLGPNYRPQQITDDLASFWKNTYPIVRKELRTRYPKHSWPENPLEAQAEAHPKRRKPEDS